MKRINRMRRLVEYRALDRAAVLAQSQEHLTILTILTVLRRGARAEAAELMRAHLGAAANAKIEKLDHAGAWSGIKPTF